MTPEQCRMARAALRWSIRDLAAKAGLAHNTILAFEKNRTVSDLSIAQIRAALTGAGILFSAANGVSLKRAAGAST